MRPPFLLLTLLALASCAPDPGMHEASLGGNTTLEVPADVWIRSSGGPMDGVTFEGRGPGPDRASGATLTLIEGAMPEDRRIGVQVDARYWIDVRPLGETELGVVQRFDYRRYWIRVRSTHQIPREVATALAADTSNTRGVAMALDLVRPLTYEVARIRRVRD